MDKIKLQSHYSDDDQYEPTDSDEDYSEEEKELLQEVRKGRVRDKSKQNEVLAFTESEEEEDDDDGADAGDDNEEDEDEMGLADSDIEGAEQNEDDLPDTKYWGKKSSAYYNTDFVDQDYSTYNEKEEELAQLEGEEAKAIQLRLAKQLKEADFELDDTFKKLKKSKKATVADEEKSTLLKADFSGLSKRERLELFEKDSPEFAGLVGDFEGYLEEVQQLHAPVLNYVRENNVPMIPALQFAQHYQNIALTYCSNLAFYLLLKANRSSIQNHPIIQRLMQLKKLLNQLNDKHENIIKPQLEALLERIQDGDVFEVLEMKKEEPKQDQGRKTKRVKNQGKLGILSGLDDTEEEPKKKKLKTRDHDDDDDEEDDAQDLATLAQMSSDDDDDDGGEDAQDGEEEYEEGEDGESRRGITYQIAKNKGLTPHRKKEQRNPRVKHRGKYRKALIRRKGAVRTVRKETSRYGGEISGIKATVSKSIKFKS
ncbi:something about silencing protein 10 [Musca domestica]|uniref:Something about silencing protein 10 n=1 Tax=Musca domestica TaxID=7370 RepID=A0A1I8NI07_MUSDO|nr:something about silencing protein 10 [Musca domestica]